MDPLSITLVANIIAVLMPYVKNGADDFARVVGKATGEDAANKAQSLLTTLKTRWKGEKEAAESLANFEEKPERYQSVMEDILKEKLVEDKELATKLAKILKDMGPTLKIIQKMKIGEDVTGVKVKKMTEGKIDVEQDIEEAKNVTGAELEQFGK